MVLWEEQVGQGPHGHPAQDFETGAPDLDAAQRWVLNCAVPSLQAGAGGCPPPSPPPSTPAAAAHLCVRCRSGFQCSASPV